MSSINRSRAAVLVPAVTITAIAGITVLAAVYVVRKQKLNRRFKDLSGEDLELLEEDEQRVVENGSRGLLMLAPTKEISIGPRSSNVDTDSSIRRRILSRNTITIAHGSVTGTCLKLAEQLKRNLMTNPTFQSSPKTTIQIGVIDEWDWWDELLNKEDEEEPPNSSPPIVLIILPTHHQGTWPPTTSLNLQSALQDLEHDWRIEQRPLRNSGLHMAAFGMGSSAYADGTIGKPAKEAFNQMRKLGVQGLLRDVGVGDDAVGNHAKRAFKKWEKKVMEKLVGLYGSSSQSSRGTDDTPAAVNWNEEEKEPAVMDLEDMGKELNGETEEEPYDDTGKEMVTPAQAKALKKEGYRLIGSHSAVKLCRWTKHQLRGRGGCYKHTFYGITSYQCMEATPSLACANKCVFCWRHHKNPVGKEWRWKMDSPYTIVDQAVKEHVKMIKEAKGIPGVQMDRWHEAHTVRHCALSLVGEPIMYPRIDEFLGELHHRKISTFLVTNGQHPEAINRIRPITQLYVSVDAPTPESLVAIDRPLFQDAWERLKESLTMLKQKGQRTVARLTVVKGWNSDEVEGYAQLIALGKVSFVEVKGVTYCGKSDASNLNMSNTPWHHEVVSLTAKLRDELDKLRHNGEDVPEYDLACEHKHSCSVLLARVDQFAQDSPVTGERVWNTWIDYDKFQELAAQNAEDPAFTFRVEDYTAPTPSWAYFGAEEEGFDPSEERHRKKKKHPKYTQFDGDGIPTHDHENQPFRRTNATSFGCSWTSARRK